MKHKIFVFKVLWFLFAIFIYLNYMIFEKSFEKTVVILLFVIANISFLNKREEV